MEKLNIGLLYLSLHNQLKKKIGIDRLLTKKEFFAIIGRHFLIPKSSKYLIIKEMESRNLIKVISCDKILVLDCEFDLEKDTNKFYKWLGVF